MNIRTCGSCTLCCRLTVVPELSKKYGEWCRFCQVGKGCRVYEKRPGSCQRFNCAWLTGRLPENLRPDKCRVIFQDWPEKGVLCLSVNMGSHDAWKTPSVVSEIRNFADLGRVVVVDDGFSERKHLILPRGKTKEEAIEAVNALLMEIAEANKWPVQATEQT